MEWGDGGIGLNLYMYGPVNFLEENLIRFKVRLQADSRHNKTYSFLGSDRLMGVQMGILEIL